MLYNNIDKKACYITKWAPLGLLLHLHHCMDIIALLRLDLFLESVFIQGHSSRYVLSMGSLDNHLQQLKL